MTQLIVAVSAGVLTVLHCLYFAVSASLATERKMGIKRPPGRRVAVWRWTKWPALLSILTDIPQQIYWGIEINLWDYFVLGMSLSLWWYFRNLGDDDPMDKLKKKIREKVAEINGRLVLVPAGGRA